MGDAFKSLDSYFWRVDAEPDQHAPDTAHDDIWMMHSDDWEALASAWALRPAGWREECAYVLEYGPPDECLPLLIQALFDKESPVALQAALSYSAQILDHSRHKEVSPRIRGRLSGLLDAHGSKNMEEVVQLLRELSVTPEREGS
jgi:hypothetical protein